MQKIYEAHWETGNEIASKNGKLIAYAQRVAFLKNRTHWSINYKNGKRQIVKRDRRTRMGAIVNRQGVTLRTRLHNLIQWRTYSTTGTTVVGGMFKSGTTEIRENGKVIGKTRVDSIGKGSINILQKLNYGLNANSDKINEVGNDFNWNGGASMKRFKGKHTKALHFAEEGRRNALGKVNDNIQNGFPKALERRARYTQVKMEKAI
jgi:hypothetical protein